jgi:hypothetical protein
MPEASDSSTVKPSPIALVLCDSIYQEQPGGKTALVGLFNSINCRSLPLKHPRMAVFASLTGLRGNSRAKLEIVHGETDQCVVAAEGPLPSGANPLSVVDMNFIFNNVVFSDEGQYFLRFWANGHPLMMRPFTVRVIKDAKNVGDTERP